MHVLGLMSGTSADGVDAVLAQFSGNPKQPKWIIQKCASIAYSATLSRKIISAGQSLKLSSHDWLELAEAITEVHAEAALACDPLRQAELVGCHGQTFCHRPPVKDRRGASLQIVQAPLLAQLLNKPVINDFRAADLALGGHGAPLVPPLDEALFGRLSGWRAVLNLGGIANLSLIPPRTGPDRFTSVFGWDCGPGNSLIDLAVQKITNGKLCFDKDGLIAAKGEPNNEIIDRWLMEPFFQKLPPKSTGREEFGLKDLDKRSMDIAHLSDENFLATITAFTAAAIANDLDDLQGMNIARPIELLVAGGGCRNPVMLREIVRRCPGTRVQTVEQLGIPVEGREALSFALLAWWHYLQHPGNAPTVTGAQRSVVLGVRVNPV